MTYPLSVLYLSSVTKNSDDIYPRACLGRTPHLSIKPCLDMTSFGNLLLLIIAMTYNLGHVWAGLPPPVNQTLSRHDVIWQPTVTIYSDDIYLRACLGRTPPPHLSIKPCLDMTSVGNLLLLFIAMTHAGCRLKLCTVTKNSDDIYSRACLGRTLLPREHDRARTPPPTCQSKCY